MYFGCCIYVLLLLNMPEMAHDWINKSILFYSILFYVYTALRTYGTHHSHIDLYLIVRHICVKTFPDTKEYNLYSKLIVKNRNPNSFSKYVV